MTETDKELIAEIRMNRQQIYDLKSEFQLFKGKAYGFLFILSWLVNVGMDYVRNL